MRLTSPHTRFLYGWLLPLGVVVFSLLLTEQPTRPAILTKQDRPQLLLPGGHDGPIYSIAYSPDGQMIASAGEGATVKVWDVATGVVIRTLSGHTDDIQSI